MGPDPTFKGASPSSVAQMLSCPCSGLSFHPSRALFHLFHQPFLGSLLPPPMPSVLESFPALAGHFQPYLAGVSPQCHKVSYLPADHCRHLHLPLPSLLPHLAHRPCQLTCLIFPTRGSELVSQVGTERPNPTVKGPVTL